MRTAAFQHDRRIRLYETENGWRLRKDVHCRNLRWTVTDTCLSPDQKYLLYASITPTVHMARSHAPPAAACPPPNFAYFQYFPMCLNMSLS
jgi:hypothetical protein